MIRAKSIGRIVPLPLALVSISHLFSHFYLVALPPLFPLMQVELGLTVTELGLTMTIVAAGLLLQVPVGTLVDTVGARSVAIAGTLLTPLGFVIIGLGGTYNWVIVGAAISGIGQASYHPANYTIIESVAELSYLGRSFSIHTFGGAIGFTLAPVVIGMIGLMTGWRKAAIIAGVLGLGFAVIFALLIHEPVRMRDAPPESAHKSSFRELMNQRSLIIMAGFFLVVYLGLSGIRSFTPLYFVEGLRLAESIGNIALSAYFAASAVSVLIGGYLADRYDPRHNILASTMIIALGLLIVTNAPGPGNSRIAIFAMAIAGFGFGLVYASRDRLVSIASPPSTAGRSFGLVFAAGAVGSMISPVAFGAVSDASSIKIAFMLLIAVFISSGLITLLLRRPEQV